MSVDSGASDDSIAAAIVAARYIGVTFSDSQKAQLVRFHEFLDRDAVRAGGIGPNERDRLWRRHIADSLVFGVALDVSAVSGECLDIGTGVGLPGVPLAIAFPEMRFTLLDRSGRRVDLVRRACAITGLDNCEVLLSDVDRVDERYQYIVSRAALPTAELMIHVKRVLETTGVAMIGLSRTPRTDSDPPSEVPGLRSTVLRVPATVLDTTVSLLRIEATSPG